MTRTIGHKISGVMYMLALSLTFFSSPVRATQSVFIEDLTSPEIRDRIKAGATTAIIPTGGSEQNGQHMVIGKHNYIVKYTTGEIAKQLGNALVAPVIAYVPEGTIEPADGHMKFAGTISVSRDTYAALLTDIVTSLKQHGFKLICFVGDSGGNQEIQKYLADKLTADWKSSGVRVLQVSDYYDNNGQDKLVESLKVAVSDPSAHAGFEDTSELMAIDQTAVRTKLFAKHSKDDFATSGSMGDSTLASAEYGKYLLDLKIAVAINQIQQYDKTK
jgi:creatinine amidohydrolase/Fe(II)-dependent formamide hydrolase-like protein